MRLLDRYLLRELLVPLGYCLSGFLILWIALDLFSELSNFQRARLWFGDIAEYYLVKTPSFLVVVLPVALLLALLYTLTNHARHHEITAIRAAGISMWRLCLPYLVVGFLASVALFAFNELWVPDSEEMADQIRARRTQSGAQTTNRNEVRDTSFKNVSGGRTWLHIRSFNIVSGDMTGVGIIWNRPDGTSVWLDAERAAWTNGVWTFYNLRQYEQATKLRPVLVTNVLAFPEFSETPAQIRSAIRLNNSLSLRKARRADIPITEILNYLRLNPNPERADARWLYTKLHGRLAIPWTCLIVVLIAIPFGAASGRRNVFVGVASSILICFVYFVLQQLCLALGTGGYLQPWLAGWLPNLAFGITGLWLTARVR